MGSVSSQPETPEQKRARLEREYGVLIPPSFVVSARQDASAMPMHSLAKLRNLSTPSFLKYLELTNPGHRLLEEFMTPGIHLSIPTFSDGEFLVGLNTGPLNNKSFLWAGQTISPSLQLKMLVPTLDPPSFQAKWSQQAFNTSLAANVITNNSNQNGGGWLEGKYKHRTESGIECVLGSWISIDSFRNVLRYSTAPSSSSTRKMSQSATVNLQAAAEYEQSLMAAEVELPLFQPMTTPNVSTMLSLNINNPKNNKNNSQHHPPLWLTLKQEPMANNKLTLNLSQILTFDRPVLNILEDRAPLVRQILGWVVQVEKETTSSGEAGSSASSACLSLGATWQWNRALALKGVVTSTDTESRLQYAVIVKRWNQPRATMSVLNSIDLKSYKNSFVGFGIELETTPSSIFGIPQAGEVENDNLAVPETPEVPTKIQIKKDKQKQQRQ